MLKPGGLSIPKSGMVPEVAGLLEFKTEGGVPEPDTPSPGGGNDVIVGAGGVVNAGGVVVTGGVGVIVTGGDGVVVTGGDGVVGVGVVDDDDNDR